MSTATTKCYLPPTGPPPPAKPSPSYPRLVHFPFLHLDQLPTLYTQGYARVHLPPDHPILAAATALFRTSRNFFAKSIEYKEQFHISTVPEIKGQTADEGWSRVEGEKELITVRRSRELCPPEIVDEAGVLWKECGNLMCEMTRAVEMSLGMWEGALDDVVAEECTLPAEERKETMMRIFRYERKGEPRLVSARHRDIGLLSLVIGSSPGLEVWDENLKRWLAIEEQADTVDDEKEKKSRSFSLTLLIGMTLTRLTNNRYKPGHHRVFVPPYTNNIITDDEDNTDDDNKYRYSIVFALRPHRSAVISTAALTTEVTGEFQFPLEGVTARTVFAAIADAHWNVNVEVEEREAQKVRIQMRRQMLTSTPAGV